MNHRPLTFIACLAFGSLLPSALAQTTIESAPQGATLPKGINDRFLADDLDPQEWLARFEIESREIYAARKAITSQLPLTNGSRVVDIGAGTGLFLELFSKAVGSEGKAYALDISPRLIEHMKQRVDQESLANVTVVSSEPESTTLPAGTADVIFVCDTYHHFEHHAEMLRSIRDTLVAGGELVVIDFERIPGVSRDWILGHVRAGKDQFRQEIVRSGFEFVEEVSIEGFEENYFLRFRKPATP
jgi:ubiquinone/menaquinone biosynthesis C-methylase UbiE